MQPVGPQVPDDQHVQQVLDLCMRMGEVLLASGEGSGETTDTMLRVANAFGLATVDVDIAFTAVTICCHRGMAATPIISLRVVKYRALDLTLLATVYRLVEDVERGRLDLLAAASTLDRAVKAVHPYPRWVATAGLAGLAGAVALLLGAPWVAVPVAGGDHRSHRRHQPSARPPAAPRVLPTGARRVHRDRGDDGVHRDRCAACGHRGGAVVAAGITVLLSGFAVVSTVQDAIGGYAVTAAGRAAEIAVASAGLLSGVVLGLKLAQRAGVQLDVAAELPADGTQITTALLASAAAAAFYAVGGYAAPQALLFAALAGIVPLLPGLTAYRGFYQLAVEGVADGLVTVTLALAIGLALAAGVALGQYLVRPNAIPLSSLPPPPPAERG